MCARVKKKQKLKQKKKSKEKTEGFGNALKEKKTRIAIPAVYWHLGKLCGLLALESCVETRDTAATLTTDFFAARHDGRHPSHLI
jgi:hypothetical protein